MNKLLAISVVAIGIAATLNSAAQAPVPTATQAPAPTETQAPVPTATQAPAAVPAPAAAAAPVPAPAAAPAVAQAPAPTKVDLPGPPDTPATYFPSVSIKLNGKTVTTGAIGLDFMVDGAAPKRAWIRVLAKTSADDIAKQVANELTFTVGTGYKVKASSKEVKIEGASKDSKPICVSVAGMTVYGISLILGKD